MGGERRAKKEVEAEEIGHCKLFDHPPPNGDRCSTEDGEQQEKVRTELLLVAAVLVPHTEEMVDLANICAHE
jgi:hypothetical protein